MAGYKVEFEETLCRGCSLCAKICPEGIIVREERVSSGGYKVPEIRADQMGRCIGCLLCADNCLEDAIRVVRVGI